MILALTLTISCSSDDDAAPTTDPRLDLTMTNLETQGTLRYSSYELIRVVNTGGTTLTTAELVDQVRAQNIGALYTFDTSGMVEIVLNSNRAVLPYSIAGNNITITQGSSSFILSDVELYDDGRMIYTSTNFAGNSSGEAELLGKFTFN